MIPALDVALTTYIKSLFMQYTVVFAPADVARASFARMEENTKVGISSRGIAVWRTACPISKSVHSIVQTNQGFPSAREDSGKWDMIKQVRVRPEYSVVCWSRNLIDRNHFEREFRFDCEDYQTVQVVLKSDDALAVQDESDVPVQVAIDIAYESDDPQYMQVEDEKTAKVAWYGLETRFYCTGAWVKSDQVPFVDKILVQYKEILEGNPVTTQLIETIQINFDSPHQQKL